MTLKNLNVLIADDHGDIRTVLSKMLRHMGYFKSIVEARDGEEAWEKLGLQKFDLIITDIDMPHLDGIGLLKRCRAQGVAKQVPFLIISGEGRYASVAAATELGADNYIVKPFSYNILKQRIDEVFAKIYSIEESVYRKAERLKEENQLQEALQTVEKLEKVNPQVRPKWVNLKGEIFQAMGDSEQASACFEKCMELSDIFLPAYKNYAKLQLDLGNSAKAIEALQQASRISPGDVERNITLGKLLLESDRGEEGRKLLAQAVRQTSREERLAAIQQVADILLDHGCLEEAEKMLVATLQAQPSELTVYNRLGIALRRQGKYQDAENCYQRALKNHPNNPIVYYNLGVLYVQQKDVDKAAQFFTKALEVDPEFEEAQELLEKLRDMH